jgi:hypothetical protein
MAIGFNSASPTFPLGRIVQFGAPEAPHLLFIAYFE